MGIATHSTRAAWFLLGLLILLNILNFVDRGLITSLQIPLREDPQLQLTDVENQLLAGYAFSVVYSFAGLWLGTLADRWHRPRLIALGLLVWSAMTTASGLAQNFWQLGLARIFVAIGEATLTPAALAMLGDTFRPRQRSLASGLYYLGVPFGAGCSLIVANLLWPIPWIGWRGCFLSLGLIGLVLVGVLLFLKDPPRGALDVEGAEAAPPGGSGSLGGLLLDIFRTLGRSPSLTLTMLGAVCVNIGVGATWLDASWLHAERGFSKQGAPIFIGVIFLFGGAVGNFLGGWLGDWFHQRRRGGRLLALIAIQLAFYPFLVAYRFLPGDSWALPVCCFFASVLVTYYYGPVFAMVQELTPVRMRATMISVLLIGLNLLGASLGAVLAAALVGRLQSYTWGIFLIGQVGLVSVLLFLGALRRYQTDRTGLLATEPQSER